MESAKHLRVLIHRNGEEFANMTFPIYSLKILDALMPENVLENLGNKNIDIKKMISDIEANGHQPQTLFEHSEEAKNYRVWIE